MWFKKRASPRRQAIREDVAEAESQEHPLRGFSGHLLVIAVLFFLVATVLQFWPSEPLAYREGERAPTDLRAPVDFRMVNEEVTAQQREARKSVSPPVLVRVPASWDRIQAHLSALKQDLQGIPPNPAAVPPELAARFPGLTDKAIAAIQLTDPQSYESQVRVFLHYLDRIVLVTPDDRAQLTERRPTAVTLAVSTPDGWRTQSVSIEQVHVLSPAGVSPETRPALQQLVQDSFSLQLVEPIVNYVMSLKDPLHRYDAKLTAQFAEQAANQILPEAPMIKKGQLIVAKGELITAQKYDMLKEAHEAFRQSVPRQNLWLSYLGRILIVGILTLAGALYVTRLTKIARSIRQAWAVCGLLLLTLIIAKTIVGFAPQSLFCLGIAPTLLATIILVIAYNQRFALGVSALHGLLVTITLGQGLDFFLPLLAGVAAFSFGLHEIRTRSKLIEIGVVASAVIFGAVWATGFAQMAGGWGAGGGASPWIASSDIQWLAIQSLWGAAAGVSVAMFALAVLPTIERLFNITTAMTLLELCDASKPLLRRLSQEAAGTFNHSLTVGIMAEAAGNAIGANGLLCRVGAYYHDVGKLSKPQYFIENQAAGHPNRHDKLSPAMSLLIIVGHVKDGIELAREYNLPWIVHQFIGQHHGTTLVEYFFHAARRRAEQDEDSVGISDTEFRYPGPKPQSRETAIVMICDGCESAVRAIDEPTAGRIESTVHNMIMKRLMDGQFAECDLTLRDLGIIEETLVRTLAAIHHGRVAYPTAASVSPPVVTISQPA
jgi:putative nucleotidyltransferase with HDIG domain